jgi:hypothetical protein
MNRRQLAIGLCIASVMVASVMVASVLIVSRYRDKTLPSPEQATPSVSSLAHQPGNATREQSNSPSDIRAEHRQLGLKSTAVEAAIPTRATFLKWQTCFGAYRVLNVSKKHADCTFYEGKPQFARAYAKCADQWVQKHDEMVGAQATLKSCGATDHIVERYRDAVRAAADEGDPDAQMCYLESDFSDGAGEPEITAADVAEYDARATQFVDHAFERGDWRIVELLASQHLHGGMRNSLPGIGLPRTVYKMDRLLRLGASGGYANFLDDAMDAILHPDLNPASALSPADAAAADAWARHTYNEHYSAAAPLTKAPMICEYPRTS